MLHGFIWHILSWFSGQPSHRHSGALLGDNPVYELGEGIISITPQNTITTNLWDTSQSSNRDTRRSESQQDREFENPIYGKQGSENMYSFSNLDTKIGMESAPSKKFDNPIYGYATDEATYSMLSVANGVATGIANR